MNALEALQGLGQSVWYDNIRRSLLESGAIAQLIAQGVTGMTSNPTIFEKAIDGSDDYDTAISQHTQAGWTLEAIYDDLVLTDIRSAATLLRPVYDRTEGKDGYVSLEVSPTLAYDSDGTIAEARRLFHALGLPNVMIKVPATPPGISAIRQLISEGINVNVTLIFSLDAYRQVIHAYLGGLQERAQRGESVTRIASVASFFVSRVDTLVDRLAEERGLPADLHGKAAIANAQLAYELFDQEFHGAAFLALKRQGAMVQRPLWASTSTKNPRYPELLYVQALVGRDTVNTLPPATLDTLLATPSDGFSQTISRNLEQSRAFLARLEGEGISMVAVTQQLLDEGVESFAASFATLRQGLARKRAAMVDRLFPPLFHHVRSPRLTAAETNATQERWADRLWSKDPGLWQGPAQAISGALGWLDLPQTMPDQWRALVPWAHQVAEQGCTDAVVLGMGGSSLVVDMVSRMFPPRPGHLRLHVLDSTHPQAIADLASRLRPESSLFLVSSKSGTTTEPQTFFDYFWQWAHQTLQERTGQHFVAITDPGTPLVQLAQDRGFARVFLNPADVGGRFSALSLFGLVPMALAGVDGQTLMERGRQMAIACQHAHPSRNPGLQLGLAMGTLAQNGHNKLTLLCANGLEPFGDWVEQLIAESTGKSGTGILPVVHEPWRPVAGYGHDRTFFAYQWAANPDPQLDTLLTDMEAQGLPLIRVTLADTDSIGAEFVRWEVATAFAGAVLEINAFDQPNVQESKDRTRDLLAAWHQSHSLPKPPTVPLADGLEGAQAGIQARLPAHDLARFWQHVLTVLQPGDYLAILAYVNPTPELWQQLNRLRQALGQHSSAAVTVGIGPRFLHSTGQFHKGGTDQGVFLQIVDQSLPELAIPGRSEDFATLFQAQAIGDFQSLASHHRRAVWVGCDQPVSAGLARLTAPLHAL